MNFKIFIKGGNTMYFYTVQLRKMDNLDKEPKKLVDVSFMDEKKPTKERLASVFNRASSVVLEMCLEDKVMGKKQKRKWEGELRS